MNRLNIAATATDEVIVVPTTALSASVGRLREWSIRLLCRELHLHYVWLSLQIRLQWIWRVGSGAESFRAFVTYWNLKLLVAFWALDPCSSSTRFYAQLLIANDVRFRFVIKSCNVITTKNYWHSTSSDSSVQSRHYKRAKSLVQNQIYFGS